MWYAGYYLKWVISTLFSPSPYSHILHPIPHPINLLHLKPLEHHSINISRSDMQAFTPWPISTLFSLSPYSHLLHPIPYPINLPLLKPLEYHSTNVPWSDMQGIVPMSDITPPSLKSFFIFKSSTLSYLLRFLLSQIIVNTVIFWFDLTKYFKSVCRELYLPAHIGDRSFPRLVFSPLSLFHASFFLAG